jgi:large subunit ribosomal protein L10
LHLRRRGFLVKNREVINLNREQKAHVVKEIKEALSASSNGIFTDYTGLSNAELMALRRKLRELDIEYRVVKNTLARFAAKKAGMDFLIDSLSGPVAIAFCKDEISQPARMLIDYIESSDTTLGITGGFMDNQVLNQDDIKILAKIPPRDVLIAQVLASMQAPITGLAICLSHPIREFGGILHARIKQLEEN